MVEVIYLISALQVACKVPRKVQLQITDGDSVTCIVFFALQVFAIKGRSYASFLSVFVPQGLVPVAVDSVSHW